MRVIPTSTTAAPSFTISPRTIPATPTASDDDVTRPTSAARSRVREWQIVTVA